MKVGKPRTKRSDGASPKKRVEERNGRRSTVITSQPPIDRWHEIIGDPTYADAI